MRSTLFRSYVFRSTVTQELGYSGAKLFKSYSIQEQDIQELKLSSEAKWFRSKFIRSKIFRS